MARTYPYSLSYDTYIGPAEDAYNFSSIYIEDLQSGQRTYVKHIQQLVDLLPRTLDPSSQYTLRAPRDPTWTSEDEGLSTPSLMVFPAT